MLAQVISRLGDECVVADLDQWYLTYGEEGWKARVGVRSRFPLALSPPPYLSILVVVAGARPRQF